MSTLVLTQDLQVLPFTHPMRTGMVGSGGGQRWGWDPTAAEHSLRGQSKVRVGAQEEGVALGVALGARWEPNGGGLRVEVCERMAVSVRQAG